MSLEVLSNSAYQGSANKVRLSENYNIQETSKHNINMSETPLVKISASNQATTEQDNGQKNGATSEQQIKNAIIRANNKMKHQRTKCEFSYHEETNRVSIKVMDKDTEEIIREIPPEETLEMIERIWELAGLLIDERR